MIRTDTTLGQDWGLKGLVYVCTSVHCRVIVGNKGEFRHISLHVRNQVRQISVPFCDAHPALVRFNRCAHYLVVECGLQWSVEYQSCKLAMLL